MAQDISLTGVEVTFHPDDLIVSKTDEKGRIRYVNDIFMDVSGYQTKECLGQPHSFIRHPDMPRCIFKLLWDTISKGHEIFAYVLNRCKNGDHYWVLAHVTADIDDRTGSVNGYHSSRRVPQKAALQAIQPLYIKLKAEEDRHTDRKAGLDASTAMLNKILEDANLTYDAFVFSVINNG